MLFLGIPGDPLYHPRDCETVKWFKKFPDYSVTWHVPSSALVCKSLFFNIKQETETVIVNLCPSYDHWRALWYC